MCWQKGGSVVTFLLKSDLLAFIWLMCCELNWCEGGREGWGREGRKLTNGVKAADSWSLTSQCRWSIDCVTLPIFWILPSPQQFQLLHRSSEYVMYIKSYSTRGGDWGGLHDRVHLREDQRWGNSGWGDEASILNWSKKQKKNIPKYYIFIPFAQIIHSSWSGKLQQRVQQADGDSVPARIPQSRIWIQQRLVNFAGIQQTSSKVPTIWC